MPIVRNSEEFELEYILYYSGNVFFEEYIPKKIASKKFEVIRISTDKSTIKLIDKYQKDLLSIVHGNFKIYNNVEYFEIVGTYSKFKRRGYLTYLFEILVYEFGCKILSDSQHSSPGSKEFWQAHIRRNRFSIYRLNLETNFKRNANRFEANEIWQEYRGDDLNSFSNSFDYIIEDDIVEKNEDVENLDGLNEIFEENDEVLNVEFKNENLIFEKIRLVAQEYVS